MNAQFLRRLSLLVAITLLICIVLPGCKSTEDMIIGQWEIVDAVGITAGSWDVTYLSYLEFFSDGTYVSNHVNYSGNFSVNSTRLKLTGILMPTLTYTFEIKGNKLYLYPNSERGIPYSSNSPSSSYIEYKRTN